MKLREQACRVDAVARQQLKNQNRLKVRKSRKKCYIYIQKFKILSDDPDDDDDDEDENGLDEQLAVVSKLLEDEDWEEIIGGKIFAVHFDKPRKFYIGRLNKVFASENKPAGVVSFRCL